MCSSKLVKWLLWLSCHHQSRFLCHSCCQGQVSLEGLPAQCLLAAKQQQQHVDLVSKLNQNLDNSEIGTYLPSLFSSPSSLAFCWCWSELQWSTQILKILREKVLYPVFCCKFRCDIMQDRRTICLIYIEKCWGKRLLCIHVRLLVNTVTKIECCRAVCWNVKAKSECLGALNSIRKLEGCYIDLWRCFRQARLISSPPCLKII